MGKLQRRFRGFQRFSEGLQEISGAFQGGFQGPLRGLNGRFSGSPCSRIPGEFPAGFKRVQEGLKGVSGGLKGFQWAS